MAQACFAQRSSTKQLDFLVMFYYCTRERGMIRITLRLTWRKSSQGLGRKREQLAMHQYGRFVYTGL